VATKADKLSRSERLRSHRELERLFQGPALPVSVATGEGLDLLWKQIARLLSNREARPTFPPSNSHR
jgi:50S ribosomal subunit-associated GTPase HflX